MSEIEKVLTYSDSSREVYDVYIDGVFSGTDEKLLNPRPNRLRPNRDVPTP